VHQSLPPEVALFEHYLVTHGEASPEFVRARLLHEPIFTNQLIPTLVDAGRTQPDGLPTTEGTVNDFVMIGTTAG